MIFASRHDAGQQLGRYLADQGLKADIVLGLPRGGIIVADGVASALNLPLAALVVRKIGHPWNREFALGAMAEGDIVVLDEDVSWASPADVENVIAEEKARLFDYQAKFHPAGLPEIKDKKVIVVDDGLATGATTEAAVRSAKKRGAAQVILAVPVASTVGAERLRKAADQVMALEVDPEFMAVGQYYRSFPQNTDEEVLKVLAAHRLTAYGPE
jgi:putative phosphoribosyl transferase